MKKIFIVLTIITAFIFTFKQTDLHAYEINTPQVYNSWIDTDVQNVFIDGRLYLEYTMDANQSAGYSYILFYMERQNFPFTSDFADVNYISFNEGITKIRIDYLTLGDMNVYQTYNYTFKIYVLASTPTPLETALGFLNRYFSIYVGSMYDFIYVANYDANQVAYNKGATEGHKIGKDEGLAEGYQTGYDVAYDLYYDSRWQVGYDEGLIDGHENFGYFRLLLSLPFTIISDMMTIEILPNVYAGYIAGIFILFGLMAFFFAIKKGKK